MRYPIWKFGWVAETSSLLNCRTGNRTGGSNPPASAERFFEGFQFSLHSRSQSTVYQLITVLFSYIFVYGWSPFCIGWQSLFSVKIYPDSGSFVSILRKLLSMFVHYRCKPLYELWFFFKAKCDFFTLINSKRNVIFILKGYINLKVISSTYFVYTFKQHLNTT